MVALLVFSSLRCEAQSEIWSNAVTANWSTAADWSGATVPNGTGYSATLSATGSYTVTLSTSDTVSTLNQSTGTLLLSSGVLYLSGGGFSSAVNGTLQLNSGSIYGLAGTNGHSLNIGGALQATGGSNNVAGYGTGNALSLGISSGGSVTASAGTLTLGNASGDSVTNAGTITASGGTINLGGTSAVWTNSGTLVATSGGTLELGGSFFTSYMGSINGTGGTVDLTGTLGNTGQTLPALTGGVMVLDGGTLSGGTVNAANNALTFGSGGGHLSGVSMVGNFSIPASAGVSIDNATTFSGNVTLGGANTLYLGGTTPTLTINPGLTWNALGSLNFTARAANASVTNNGTMDFLGGTLGGGGYAGFVFTNASTGDLTNSGSSLSVSTYAGDAVSNSGTILNVSTGTASAALYIAAGLGSSLTNTSQITNNASGSASSSMYLAGGTNASLTNSGTILSTQLGTGSATTYIGYAGGTTVTNTGTVQANGTGSVLYLGNSGSGSTWTNTGGTIEATNGASLYLGGTFSNATLTAGTIKGTGATLFIDGTLNNSGTLAAPDGGGTFTLTTGGTISGGTVDGSNGALAFGAGGTLSGVSVINATTVAASSYFTVTGGTTFGGNVSLAGSNTVYLAGVSGGLAINPGLTWTEAGTLNVLAQAASLSVVNQGTMNLAGGTIGGYGYAGFTVTNASTGVIANTGSSLQVAAYGGDAMSNAGSVQNQSSGSTAASLYLAGGSGSSLTNTGQITDSTTGTSSAYMSLASGANATLNNSGTVLATQTGTGTSTAYLGNATGTTIANTGTLHASGTGASLYLGNAGGGSTWTNAGGTIEATGGASLYLGGTFSTATLTAGTISGVGSTVYIDGTLNNSGTLAGPDGGGLFTLASNGSIVGGTIDGSVGALTFSNGGTLSGVSVVNALAVPASSTLTASNGTTFGGNMSFGSNDTVYLGASEPLAIGPSQTWTASGTLNILSSANGNSIVNQGAMNLQGGTIGGYGTTGFVTTNTSSGTLTNTSSTVGIGDFSGDTVNNAGTMLDLAAGTLNAQLYIGEAAATVNNTALIKASTTGSGQSYLNIAGASGATLTNSGTVVASQTGTGTSLGYVGYAAGSTVTNTGTLQADGTGASLYVGSSGSGSTWTNAGGTIEATNGGIVYLGGTFTSATLTSGTISGAGGTVAINGTLNNSGTLAPPDGGGIFTLMGGTIAGGTISSSSNALVFSTSGGTLNNVALTGNFGVPVSAYFTVENGTSFSGGSVTFGGSDVVYMTGTGSFTLPASETWSDSGYLSIYGQAANLTFNNQGSLSVAGGTIYGEGYAGFLFNNTGTVTNNGANVLYLGDASTDTITNLGSLVQNGSGGIYLGYSGAAISNLISNTLTGGSWSALGGGTITFQETTNAIVTNDATLILSGAGSEIRTETGSLSTYQTVEQTLTTNNGTLEVLGNRNFAATNPIANNGTIALAGGTFSGPSITNGSGATLEGTGSFSPSAGVTIGGGMQLIPGVVGGSYIGALGFGSSTPLTFASGGSMTFSLMNAPNATAGVDYSVVNVSGTLAVTATPAAPFTINVQSINPSTGTPGLANFSASQGYTWTLATAGTLTGFNAGAFSISTASFTNSLGTGAFYVTDSGNNLLLNFSPVPEPETWALMGAGALGLAAAWTLRLSRLNRLTRAAAGSAGLRG